jgi:hypothetical protein
LAAKEEEERRGMEQRALRTQRKRERERGERSELSEAWQCDQFELVLTRKALM